MFSDCSPVSTFNLDSSSLSTFSTSLIPNCSIFLRTYLVNISLLFTIS
nr:MAG TPA: hypothetical protein [Caudoviricetes sp.]